MAVPSALAVTRRSESGLQATAVTPSRCPWSVKRRCPARASKMRVTPSSPAVAMRAPSGLHAAWEEPGSSKVSTRLPDRTSTMTAGAVPRAIAIWAPLGSNEVLRGEPSTWISRTIRPLVRSRIGTRPSFDHAAANRVPSGLKEGANASLPAGLCRACASSPVSRSQTLASPSSPVVPSRVPSGLKAMPLTRSSWPAIACTCSPVAASWIVRVPSGSAAANRAPSGLHATAPPTPGTRRTARDAVTAAWSACSASASTAASPSADRASSTASRASRTLRSASTSRLALAAAARLRAFAVRRSRTATDSAVWAASACSRASFRLVSASTLASRVTTSRTAAATSNERRRRFWRRVASGPLLQRDALGGRVLDRCLEELDLDLGEVGVAGVPPLEGGFEAGAAVQLGRRSPEAVPPDRGRRQVTEGALPGGVLVEPGLQSRPGPRQGLVGQLDRVGLGGHQAGAHQQRDDPLVVGVAPQRPPVDAEPDRSAVG